MFDASKYVFRLDSLDSGTGECERVAGSSEKYSNFLPQWDAYDVSCKTDGNVLIIGIGFTLYPCTLFVS